MEELAEQREIEFFRLGSGVKVEFARPGRETFDDAQETRGGHAAGVAQAEDGIGSADVVRGEPARGGDAERAEDQRNRCAVARLADEADGSEAAGDEFGQRELEDSGVQVQVSVTIEMTGRKPQFIEASKLRGNLARQRRPGARVKGVSQASRSGRFDETAVRIGQRGHIARLSVAEGQVQADTERGIAACDPNGFLGALFVHHQAGLGEQAGLVMALDGFVDGVAAAEVVAGEDEAAGRRVVRFQFSVFNGAMQ